MLHFPRYQDRYCECHKPRSRVHISALAPLSSSQAGMTFTVAKPSADDIAKAPRAFALHRQALGADGSIDAQVRRSLSGQLLASWVTGSDHWSSLAQVVEADVKTLSSTLVLVRRNSRSSPRSMATPVRQRACQVRLLLCSRFDVSSRRLPAPTA